MPKVSVIMPAYNADKYIKEAIDSILGQTFTDFEFIILNDCSTDRTEEIILSYHDPRIVYLKNEKNLGVAATLNKGLAAAKGEYIARMDADDISLPERFQQQVIFLEEHPQVVALGSAVEQFSGDKTLGMRSFAANGRQMDIDMLFSCGLAHPSVMLRAEAIFAQAGYDPDYEGLEDYELWWRLSGKGDIEALPQILLRYREHDKQVTKKPSKEYLVRFRRLKKRQMEALGLAADEVYAESYYRFCEGNRPTDLEGAKTLNAFFEMALDANKSTCKYDQQLLERHFKCGAVNVAAGLRFSDAFKLCCVSGLVRTVPLARQKFYRLVKRLRREPIWRKKR